MADEWVTLEEARVRAALRGIPDPLPAIEDAIRSGRLLSQKPRRAPMPIELYTGELAFIDIEHDPNFAQFQDDADRVELASLETWIEQLRNTTTRESGGGATGDPASWQTGGPGKPSKSAHVINAEFKRRIANDAVEPILAEQARVLLGWLQATYPSAPPPRLKTIQNNIREEWQKATGRRV